MQRLVVIGSWFALSLLGCSLPPVDGVTATRWIDGEPADFDPSSLYASVSRGSWMSVSDPTSTVVIERAAEHDRTPEWLALTPIDNHAIVVTEAVMDADRVDFLRLTSLSGVRAVHLQWAGPGEAFSGGRQVLVEQHDHAVTTFEFEVAEHELWRGAIERLRLILWSEDRFGLGHLEAFERRLDRDRLLDAARSPWKVAVDEDLRAVRLVVPEAPVEERRIDVVDGSRLAFGYATHRRNDTDLALRLIAEADGDSTVLFSTRLGTAAPTWRDAEVDLSTFAGKTVDLRFEVDPMDGFGETTGLPLIAHPMLLQPTEDEPPPNVVLIVLDTLRPDRLSLYGYDRPTSPHLDAWAERRAAVFTRAISQAGWTLPAHASLFSGLDPQRHGLTGVRPMPAELATLTTVLADRGYTTWATTGGAYLDYHYGFDRGFDSYRTWRDSPRKDDEPVEGIERTLAAIERLRDRPFFLFFHTYAVHGPYKAWQPHFGEMSDLPDDIVVEVHDTGEHGVLRREIQRLVDGRGEPLPAELEALASDQYDSGIARLDLLLRPLFDVLGDPELARRTIVVVTSDHGEMFGEHGVYDHGYLWDQNLLVPLILAEPQGRSAGARITRQVRLTDIAPTLLELTGSPAMADIDGTSLVPLLEGRDEPPPQVAWSYSNQSELGLAARYRDRYKLIVHDAPWEPFRGREQVWRVDSPDGLERRVETMPEELVGLGELARRQLAAALPGLRLRIKNPTDRVLRGAIEGRAVAKRHDLKTPLRGCDCLEWQQSGVARWRVPAGQELFVILTSLPDPGLHLVLESEGLPVFDQVVELPAVSAGVGIEWVRGAWHRSEIPPGDASPQSEHPTVELWWHQLSGAGERLEENSEVLEQLRALGYVD